MTERILVIAFDGLDKDLVERFELENVIQEEFGSIDNNSQMTKRMTSELFASFITGKNHAEHGIEGLVKPNSATKKKIVEFFRARKLKDNVRGYTRFWKALKTFLDYKQVKYSKNDLKTDTIFEELIDSKALFIPSYNPSLFWMTGADFELLQKDGSYSLDDYNSLLNRDFEFRRRRLFRELESENPPAFLMAHFHKVDTLQHLLSEESSSQLKPFYEEIDKLAGKIIELAEPKYDEIIFMSDHGLPTKSQHNKKAFYSSSKPYFKSEPHITDFYHKFIEKLEDNRIDY